MKKTVIEREPINLMGISVRTSYTQELDKMAGNILPLIQRYFHQALFEQIPQRKHPGATYCVYTDYDGDYRGGYTYFVGEEVTDPDVSLPEGFERLTIPHQSYAKFTTGPEPMPDVVVNAWTQIWEMDPQELGGQRRYHTDFEIYDERAADHSNIVMDLYIGLK